MDHKRVIESLTQGKQFAKQLQIHLDNPSSSHETQEILIHNILNSYYKSLSLLTRESHLHAEVGITRLESQVLLNEIPHSEDSNDGFKELDHKDLGAKRSNGSMEKWKNEVKVRGDMGFEEALDDGYSWRKYAQKDILRATHPRGYYRCTYRQVEGCLATKQVQRTDDDPNVFNMTYRGSHTCNLGTHKTSTLPLPSPPPPQLEIQHPPQQNQPIQCPKNLLTFQAGCEVTTENLETSSFPVDSTSNSNFIFPTLDNTFDSNTSPSFISSTTSGSTYFTLSQPQASAVRKSTSAIVAESELHNVFPVATSSTGSRNVDVAFPFGQLEVGNDFSFDNSMFLN